MVIGAKEIFEVAGIAYLTARKLREEGVGGVRVSKRGIEELARRELHVRGLDQHSRLVGIDLIPIKTHLTGPAPSFEGYSVVFALDDGRLVTMRWTLDGPMDSITVGEGENL